VRKKLFLTLRIVVTFAVFFALFKFIPYQKLIEVYKESRKTYLVLGLLIFFSTQVILVARWKFLLSSLGVAITFSEAFLAFFSGLFFNLFFPSFVAGDIFRGFSISYRHGDVKKVASSLLMDRFSGAVALASVSFCAFIAGRNLLREEVVVTSLSILCAIIIFVSLIIFSKSFFLFLMKIFRTGSSLYVKLRSFHDQFYFFKKKPNIFFKSLLFSFPIQILIPLGFFVVSRAFGVQVGVINFLILVPIIIAIAMVPVTIAGVGTREASAVYFFSLVGIEKSIGFGISLLNLVFFVATGIIGGILYVTIHHRRLQSCS